MDKAKRALLAAVAKGYRFSMSKVIGPRGKPLAILADKNGYPYFNISLEGRVVHVPYHRLKAYYLFGKTIFEDGIQVRHLNGRPSDYSDGNISIGTQKQNSFDRPPQERLEHANKATAKVRKFRPCEVSQIRKIVEVVGNAAKVGRAYGVCKSTMSYLMNGKTYNYSGVAQSGRA